MYCGGKHWDAEMARQPALVGAIKTEMVSQEFRVRFELIEISEFLERYPGAKSKTSKPTKENGKPKDGEGGKDKRFFFLSTAERAIKHCRSSGCHRKMRINHQDIEYQCPEEKEKLTNVTNRAFPNSLRNRT